MFMMQQLLNKLKNTKLLFIVIIILQICVLFYYMNSKSALFLDETYTYSTANSSYGILFPCSDLKYVQNIQNYNYRWLSGNFIRDYVSVSKKQCFNYSNIDENHLFDSHPPLYSYLLHTICSFFPETFSKWYGFSLNIVIFIFVQVLLYNISAKIFCSKKYALLTSLTYGFSAGSIDCFIYIRMYSLSTMFFLLLLNLYLTYLDNKFTLLRFFTIATVVFLGGLNHYHFFVYAFILTLTYIIVCLIDKKYKSFYGVSFAAIVGVILFFLYFPAFAFQIENTPRASEVLNFKNSLLLNDISYIFQEFFNINQSFSIYFSILLLIFLGIALINNYSDKVNSYPLLITVIPTFIFIIFVSLSVNYYCFGKNGERFFLVVFPFIFILLIYIILNSRMLLITFVLLSFISGFFMVDFCYKDINGYNTELEKIFNGNNIVLYCDYQEIIQVLSIKLLKCNNIMIIPRTQSTWFPKHYPQDGKTYFVFINNKGNLNSSFELFKENKYYNLQYFVYIKN